MSFLACKLLEFGWNTTLVIFGVMIIAGLIIAFFLSTPMEQTNQENEINQTFNVCYKIVIHTHGVPYIVHIGRTTRTQHTGLHDHVCT